MCIISYILINSIKTKPCKFECENLEKGVLKIEKDHSKLLVEVQSFLKIKTEYYERLKKIDERTPHESTWAPILWAMKLLTLARMEKKVTIEAPIFANLQNSFDELEKANRKILNYGWGNFPLAYVQVATISVHLYIFVALFGRQYLTPEMNQGLNLDMFPLAKYISFSNNNLT